MVDDDMPVEAIDDTPPTVTPRTPWFRRRGTLVGIAVALAAVIAALVFASGRVDSKSVDAPVEQSAPSLTIQQYFKDTGITSTQVRRGDPGAPLIGLGLMPGWSGLGPDTPPWSYGAVRYDAASNPSDPPTIDVLLFKLTGDVDQTKILEYAPNELANLPDYQTSAEPHRSKLSGFDAVQLAGTYTRDGVDRSIAQKTVVIPSGTAFYVLQINVDALIDDSEAVMLVTGAIDERTVITP